MREPELLVSSHAELRLRERYPETVEWSRESVYEAIQEMISAASLTIARNGHERYLMGQIADRPCVLVLVTDPLGETGMVKTVLTPAQAANNLEYSHRRGCSSAMHNRRHRRHSKKESIHG